MPAASNYRIIMDFGASSRIDAGCADGWGVSFAMLSRTAYPQFPCVMALPFGGKGARAFVDAQREFFAI